MKHRVKILFIGLVLIALFGMVGCKQSTGSSGDGNSSNIGGGGNPSTPPAPHPGQDTGSPQPKPPAALPDTEAKIKVLFERLTDAILRFEEAVDVGDLNIGCKSKSGTEPEYKELYERFLHYLDENNLFLFLFSYDDMSIYRSRFDGSDKTRLYRKMYHTNNALQQSDWAKLHRLEFGADKIYFIDYAASSGTDEYALYTMQYDGSSVQKAGTLPPPDKPLRPAGDNPEPEAPGTAALRAEVMLCKMKDAYFHGTEAYSESKNTDRTAFCDKIRAAEAFIKTDSADEDRAGVLYKELRQARIEYAGQPTSRP